MKFILVIFFFLLIPSNASAGDLQPFTSDGCSAFPDGTIVEKSLWRKCCVEHDKAYWAGGSVNMRKQADVALKVCVAQVGEPEIAKLMLAGVRVGGSPYWPTSFRWGYGWPYLRGYKELTAEEKAMVENEMTVFVQTTINQIRTEQEDLNAN